MNRIRNFSTVTLIVISIVFFFNSVSWSIVRFGNMRIKSFVGMERTTESNVYQDADNPQSAVIRNLNYGVNLYLPIKKHEFDLSYNAHFLDYSENPSRHNTINNNADILAKLDFNSGLFITLKDIYRGSSEPPISEFAESVKYNHNTFIGCTGYKFGERLTISLSGFQQIYDYLQESYKPALNRRETETNMEVAYKIFTKSSFLIQYGFGTVDYVFSTNSKDNTYGQIMAGIKGKLAPKTSGEIKAGSKSKKYDTLTGEDVSTSVLSFNTITSFSQRTNLNLTVNRNFVESSWVSNNYYVGSGFSADFSQKLYRNWAAAVHASYDSNDYPNDSDFGGIIQKRLDKNSITGLKVDYYPFSWVVFNGGVSFKNRDSNYQNFKYSDTLVTLGMRVVF